MECGHAPVTHQASSAFDRLARLRVGPGAWTVLAAMCVAVATYAFATFYYAGKTTVVGPDAADVLATLFFDINRAMRTEGLLAGMFTPTLLGGVSHWASPHFHPLYPLYFNWLANDASLVDTWQRLDAINRLHLGILGAGGFFLSRALGMRWIPAVATGLLLPWYPAVQTTTAWTQIVSSLAWIPWVFAFQVLLYRRRDARDVRIGISGLAVSAILLVLAQPAQNLAITIVGSGLTWLLLGGTIVVRRDRAALHRFAATTACLGAAGAIVLVVTGAYLAEVANFHSASIRWLGEIGGHLVGSERVPVAAMRWHALSTRDAVALLAYSPDYSKGGIGNAYAGAGILFCTAVLLVRARDDVERALSAVALLVLLFSFAAMAPLLHAIPVANRVREITWWACLSIPLLVPLALLGLDRLAEGREGAKSTAMRLRWIAWACALGASLGVLWTSHSAHQASVYAWIAAGFAAIAFGALLPTARHAWVRTFAALLLLASVAGPARQQPVYAASQSGIFQPDRVMARQDSLELVAALPDAANYRLLVSDRFPNFKVLTHAYSTRGLRLLRGDLTPQVYDKFRLLYFPTPAVAALYGVKYTVIPAGDAVEGDRRINPRIAVRTNPAALPRLFFAQGDIRAVVAPVDALLGEPAAVPVAMYARAEDLPELLDPRVIGTGAVRTTAPTLLMNRTVRVRAVLVADGPGLVVLNEDPDARWTFRLNGERVAGFRINGFQTAALVPAAGTYDIDISRPSHLF